MKSRSETLRAVQGQTFDVCVIGAGATGAACALDSQLRGLNTVLLDGGDFAGATSSASTKIVHGGVRYLERALRNFDAAQYHVVRRALCERARMFQNGPYLCRSMEFLIPCFCWTQVVYYGMGLKIYDWMAHGARLYPSRFLNRRETLRRMPGLKSDGLLGSIAYTDGQFDDSRYNIALVATFVEGGGKALNYLRVSGFEKRPDGKLTSAFLEDQLEQRSFRLQARLFINAAGPLADGVRRLANPDSVERLRPSKGVHILLPMDRMPSDAALLIPKTEDGRVLFVIPWQGRLVLGTTDEDVEMGEELHINPAEVDYLLRHLNRYLAHPVTADQIVSGIAGARPLLRAGNGRKTKDLARDIELECDERSGLLSVMGGKWTTHRAMAEETMDAAERSLGIPVTTCRTVGHPLLGSEGYTPNYWLTLAKDNDLPETTARHLASKFGTQAPKIIEIARQNPQLANPILPELSSWLAEVVYCVQNEMAVTIEDVLFRRIGIQLDGWRNAIQAAPAVAAIMARELGWSEEFRAHSVTQYVGKIHQLLQLAGLSAEPQRE